MANDQPIGKHFGRWTLLSFLSRPDATKAGKKGHGPWYRCKCECGFEAIKNLDSMKSGRSTGCMACTRTQGGLSKTRGYKIWLRMNDRCHNPKADNFRFYGAKGISVCERWRESFANFLADMGQPPTLGHSIDRIDPKGNYEPCNCRWATKDVQAKNCSSNLRFTIGGETMILKDWARLHDIKYLTLYQRIRRGLTIEAAIALH